MSSLPLRGSLLAALLLVLAALTPLPAQAQAALRVWSTYLGGNGADRVTGLAQSPVNGNVVAVGTTTSQDFPPPRTGAGASTTRDAFVAVFKADGTLPANPFVFGGPGEDVIHAVALGPQGQIYVVGMTQTAAMPGFSTRYRTHGGGEDGFLARLSADGTPVWLMYLDSPGRDMALGLAVSGNDIYVTGATDSALFMSSTGTTLAGLEGFVVKLVDTSTGEPTVPWKKFFPGNGDDRLVQPLVMGPSLVAVGSTSSSALGPGVPQGSFQGGGTDALAAKLNTSDGAVAWVRYLGGPGPDDAVAAVPWGNGEAVVVGTTAASQGGKNAFATWLDPGGMPRRSESLGGGGDELVSSALVDASGNLYIGGQTSSPSNEFAQRAFDSSQEVASPALEGFVLMVPARGGPGWASYVGGNGPDHVLAMSMLGHRLVLAGDTASSADLVAADGHDPSLSTARDGFLLAVNADITPAQGRAVFDRDAFDNLHVDIAMQTSRTSISANWEAFTDEETGVERYEWAIGTSPGSTDVWPFTPVSIGGTTTFMKTGLNLQLGMTYYVTVRAINGAGLTSTASSNGVQVVDSLPDGGADAGLDAGVDGGRDGGSDGGTDGGADGGTDGGSGGGGAGGPEDEEEPLQGWSCASADASLSMFLGLLALLLLTRGPASSRRG